MNLLVTICGRAGSKGVKNKNMRLFLGHPLIKYTISAAYLFRDKNSGYNVDICVNSDSEDLLDMVSQYNLTCIKRPSELAQDTSPKVPVIRYSLNYMEDKHKKLYDYVIDLDITSPLRTFEDIQGALNKAMENIQNDVVFSVVPSRRNPYFNMVEKRDGKVQRVIRAGYVTRQQAPNVYDMNASIYCYRRNSLQNILDKSPLDGTMDIVEMTDTAVLDIDSEEDFELMELLAKYFLQKDQFKELSNYINKI